MVPGEDRRGAAMRAPAFGQVAHRLLARSFGMAQDAADLDLHGKVAVFLVNDPDFEAAAGDPVAGKFGGQAMTFYGRWVYKFEEAARRGAIAALIVHDTPGAGYGWNVVQSSWSGAQAYAQRADDGASQTMVNGWVQKPVAERIFAAAGQDFAKLAMAACQPGFKPVPLGLKANLSFTNQTRRFASKNVIGILPGTKRPNDYVLYSAHWDHLGRCTPNAAGLRNPSSNGNIRSRSFSPSLSACSTSFPASTPSSIT